MSHNQASEMASESSSANGTNILNVTFHCLDAIFSSKCLSIEDFCSIAETHTRLKEVVDGVVAKRHKNYLMKLRDIKFEREKTRRILRNFGAFISELSIDVCDVHEEIISECLDWVMENCSDTLESLELLWLKITENQSNKLKSLFDKLQKISLYACDVYSCKMLLNNCESLVELKLHNEKFDGRDSALKNIFPKLYCFEYPRSDLFGDSIWNGIFSRHKTLKVLSLTRWEGTADLLPIVADNCKQLAELNILFEKHEGEVKFRTALGSILTLENLNKLDITCEFRNITKFIEGLASLKSLEFLCLRLVVGDSEFVAALSKLTRLLSLKLLNCGGLTNLNQLEVLEGLTELEIWSSVQDLPFDLDLVAMIKRLIRLKTLHLWVPSFRMGKRMYQQIVDVLRERPANLQDTLQIRCYTARDFVGDKILITN